MVIGSIYSESLNYEVLDHIIFACSDRYSSKADVYVLKYLENLNEQSNVDAVEPVNSMIAVGSSELPRYSTTSGYGGPMDSPWPMKCHDTHHTGRSPYSTADNPLDEKWRFKADDWIEAGIIIDNDGIIYFGDFDRYCYAVYPNGTLKWKYKTGGWIWSTPAIAEDGTVYFGSMDCKLYAFDPNGNLKWKVGTGGSITSPAIADDGAIYFGTMRGMDEGEIIAVNPNGTIKWRYETGYYIASDPAIGDDGTIYIGSGDNYLYAMNPNGTLKWRYKTGDWVKAHPSIADDGTIYFYSFDDYFYALNPNGTVKWKEKYASSGCVAAVIAEDGTLYLGGDKLYAINPDGTLKWSFNFGSNRRADHSSPAISADGTIFVGVWIGEGNGGEVIAVNPDGTERWRSGKICSRWIESSPSIGSDGTVYIGSTFEGDGYLFAFNRAELQANAEGPEYGLINTPIVFNGSGYGGYKPYSFYWDFGDDTTSNHQNPVHIFTNDGDYNVTLTVTDDNDTSASDFTFIHIQSSNSPPNIPNINGPTNGDYDTKYDYTISTIDLDDNPIYYYVEWGDGKDTGWLGPYSSGEEITKSHKWTDRGAYTIRIKAKDVFNEESDWTTLEVSMPKNKAMDTPLFNFLENHPYMFQVLRKIFD